MEYNKKCGFVIGNGESRRGFDLNQLRPLGPIYGCNALYRDFSPTVLFSRDTPMVKEISQQYSGLVAKYEKPHMRYGGVGIEIPHSLVLAGSVALWCMCQEHRFGSMESIYLLGFDPYPSLETGQKNNIYKDTSNYGSHQELASPRANQCIKDLELIASHYNHRYEISLVNDMPVKIQGVSTITYEMFTKVVPLQ